MITKSGPKKFPNPSKIRRSNITPETAAMTLLLDTIITKFQLLLSAFSPNFRPGSCITI